MRLLLAFLFLVPVVSAQAPDSLQIPLPRGERAALVLGGAAAGVVAVTATHLAVRAVAGTEDVGWSFLAYPLGVAAGVHVVARGRGLSGSAERGFHGALRGSLLGAAGGYALGYAGLSIAGGPFGGGDERAGGLVILAGLAVVVLAPPYAASRGYRVATPQPVVLVGLAGERATGLALHVAL